jgi:dolichol-phosphate mannosyltransferase
MMLGYVFYSMTTKNYVSGWASMMAVMLIGFSFQSFLLGLLGEYVGRIFLEAKRRPLYIIREIRRTN